MEQPQKKSFFDRFKRNNSETDTDKPSESIDQPNLGEKKTAQTFLGRMRKALSRTSSGFSSLFLGKKVIDAEILEELETLLLVADVGIEVTNSIIQELTEQVKRNQLQDGAALHLALKKLLHAKLQPCEMSLNIDAENGPYVILVVGVNGVGKTTTIGKIANRLKQQGKSVLLAAGDTFRAAAVEQLQSWGERNQVSVVAQDTGADSASVIFDAMQSAKAKNCNVVLADTAGRLHTQDHLMAELGKIKRVMQKFSDTAPHETILVIDGSIGQNSLQQAKQFNQVIPISGLVVTKLDGTAKGGMLFSLTAALNPFFLFSAIL